MFAVKLRPPTVAVLPAARGKKETVIFAVENSPDDITVSFDVPNGDLADTLELTGT